LPKALPTPTSITSIDWSDLSTGFSTFQDGYYWLFWKNSVYFLYWL